MISLLSILLQTTAPAPAPVPVPARAPAPAPWTVSTRPNADPTITSTVTGTPSDDNGAKLVFRCDSGKVKVVSIQLFTRAALGGPPNRPVSLTIDGGTPLIDNWEFVPQGAFQRADVAVTTTTAAIAAGKSIKLHTTTTTGEPIDATFAGPPSDASIKAVLAACDYTLGQVPVRPKDKKGK
jgi:hypothetical protein